MTTYEHVIYSWATKTVDGTGYGIVGSSIGWTPRIVTKDGNLGSLSRFLPRDVTALSNYENPLRSVELLLHPLFGRVLVKKTYLGADTANRPGRYVAHIVKIGDRGLSPLEALTIAQGDGLLDNWGVDADWSTSLPPLILEPPRILPPLRQTSRAKLTVMLAGILDFLSLNAPLILITEQHIGVEDAFTRALRILPTRLVASLTFSTYSSVPAASTAGLTLANLEYSELGAATAEILALDEGLGFEGPSTGSQALAHRLVQMYLAGSTPPREIDSVPALSNWLQAVGALAADPATLGDKQVLALVLGTAVQEWLSVTGAPYRLARWIVDNRRSPGVVADIVTEPVRVAIADCILAAVEQSARLAPADVDVLSDIAGRWGATPEAVVGEVDRGLRSALMAGTIAPAHAQHLRNRFDRMLETIPACALLNLADVAPFVLLAWSPVAAEVATATWTDPPWLHSHESLAAKIANEFPRETAGAFPHGTSATTWSKVVNAVTAGPAHVLASVVYRSQIPQGDKLRFSSELNSSQVRDEVLDHLVRARKPQQAMSAPRSFFALIAWAYIASLIAVVLTALAMALQSLPLVLAIGALMIAGWLPLFLSHHRAMRAPSP